MMTTMQIYRSAWLIAIALTPVAALAQNAPERPQPAGPPTMAVGPQIQRIETASAVSTGFSRNLHSAHRGRQRWVARRARRPRSSRYETDDRGRLEDLRISADA
jgi:hypothetical protein